MIFGCDFGGVYLFFLEGEGGGRKRGVKAGMPGAAVCFIFAVLYRRCWFVGVDVGIIGVFVPSFFEFFFNV